MTSGVASELSSSYVFSLHHNLGSPQHVMSTDYRNCALDRNNA